MVKIKKQYKEKYTVVLNQVLEDARLSYKAVGLFVDLWHSPDDWNYYLSEIVKRHSDGKDSVNSGLEELEQYGYLKRSKAHRDGNGRFGSYDWDLSEIPMLDQNGKPATDNNHVGKSTTGNPPLQSTKRQSTEINKVNKESSSSETSENPYELYRQMTGFTLTGLQQPKMMDFIKTDGTELVVSALKTAQYIAKQSNSKPSYNLFDRVMHEWESNGIKTVDQAREYEKKRLHDKQERMNKSKQAFRGYPTIDRKIPESMKEEYDPEKDKLSDEDKASLKKELEEFYERGKEEQE